VPRARRRGVAGYEAVGGHDVTPDGYAGVRACLRELRAAVARLAGLLEADEVVLTAGGSTYFDAVADKLTALPSGAGSSSASRTRAWCSTSGS
jgi:hypothetical protein